MLKITQIPGPDSTVMLKVEGKLLEPWIDELFQSVAQASVDGKMPHLDLTALSYADQAGTRVLSELVQRGAVIMGASGFMAALLRREKS